MYLYSAVIGTFVFNQNFQVREKVLFKDKEILKNFEHLKNNEVLDTEKEFLERFKSIINLREKPNPQYMEKVIVAMNEFTGEFRHANLYLTKHQVKDSVSDDLLIIQTSDSITEINKTINILNKRLREWYSYCLPEVEDRIGDHREFTELILNKSREELVHEFSIKDSMGKELSKEDNDAIMSLANAVMALFKQKDAKERYLEILMKKTCPNMTAVAGYLIGAKLMAIARSLRDLVMMPASTIQLLGAEKALFKHMVNKSIRPPKHGVIIDHPLLQKAPKDMRGKVARALADKISLCVKLDYFKGEFLGDKLRKGLEEKFK